MIIRLVQAGKFGELSPFPEFTIRGIVKTWGNSETDREIFAIHSTWSYPASFTSVSEVFSRIRKPYSVVKGARVVISGGTVLVGTPPVAGTAISWASA